jgi:pyruvate kinase
VAQKKIIEESHKYGVPTIVATQMLESMVSSSSPTRAEVSDVTNAIMDNTDCVMLSEETAIGKFPAEAVEYLNKISAYVEDKVGDFSEPDDFLGNRVAYSISRAAKVVASEIEADGIVAFTQSGNTAKMISAVRPRVPIYTMVTDSHLGRKLNLFRGIMPVKIDPVKSDDGDLYETILKAEKNIKMRKGARLVITSGAPNFLFGGTNEVMVSTFGKFIGRGYPSGKSFKGIVAGNRVKGDILIVKDDVSEERDDFRKYKGIIFTGKASHEVMEALESSGIPVLFNTKIREKISEGDEIFVDGYTGIINS